MIHWNVSPEIFSLGPLTIRWYGLLFATGFLLGQKVVTQFYLNEKKPLLLVDRLLVYLAVGTVIGARLGHTLFYEPEIYLADPIRILKVWEGGLASHGAVVGVLLAMWLYSRKFKLPLLWVFDRVAVAAPLAGACIRMGNLFNSEIIGKASSLPWATVFMRIDAVPRHPTQVYESLAYFAIFAVLYRLYWIAGYRQRPGFLSGMFFILVFTTRFLVEFCKENQVSFESSLPVNMGQILSIPMVVLGIYLIYRSSSRQTTPAKRA